MKTSIAFLKLFRFQNLLIIALLLYFVRYFIIQPIYSLERLSMQIDSFSFFLFVIGYIFIIAGGYAINDYYDIGIDEVNKPDKTILRKEIPLSYGQAAYYLTTVIGVILSIWAIMRIQAPKLIFVLIIVTLLFWFYSTKYKREFISGNLAISLLAAAGVAMPWLYEFFASIYNAVIPIQHLRYVTGIISIYAMFAFLLTFMREIIKDIIDIDGDRAFECVTIPIRLGIVKTKLILYGFSILLLGGLVLILRLLYSYQLMYLFIFAIVLFVLMIYFFYLLYKAREFSDYKKLSDMMKLLFLAGILSMQLFYLEL
jgi:4-hydroxybenzoate polyprenyltransferase